MALMNAAFALTALMLMQSEAEPAPAQVGRVVESEDVVVVAPRAEEVRAFVDALSAEAESGQLARWDRQICPGVMGARTDAAEFLLDRIAVRAYEVGLDVGEPGCRANVLILVTDESDAVAQSLQSTRAVSYYGQSGNTRGRAAFRDFRDTPRAVRWWHVTRTMTADGAAASSDSPSAGGAPTTVQVRTGGRIRSTTREDFNHVIIVLDTARASGIPFGALADYIAMVTLAQIDPSSDLSEFPSILNMFTERDAGRDFPLALTDWDKSYLVGLYGAPRDARNARQQQRAIERQLRRGR